MMTTSQMTMTMSQMMEDHSLQLARKNTAVVIIIRRQITINTHITEVSSQTQMDQVVGYLGVTIDKKLTYWKRVKKAADKAVNVTTNLSNIGGTKSNRQQELRLSHSQS